MAAAFGAAAAAQAFKDATKLGWDQLGSFLNTKRAWGAQKNAQKESYKNIKEGLRRAGFNPILAVGGRGLAGANVPQLYQPGQTAGDGKIGGTSAKELAGLDDQLGILKQERRLRTEQANSAAVKALNDMRESNALNDFYASGRAKKAAEDRMQATPMQQGSNILNAIFGHSARNINENEQFNKKHFPDKEIPRYD